MQKGAVGSSSWMKVQLARYNSQGGLSASLGCPSKRDCDQEVLHGLPPKHLSPFCNTAKALPRPGAERGHSQTQLFPPGRLLGGVCLFHPGGREKALFDRGERSQLPTAVLVPPHTSPVKKFVWGASHQHCLRASQLHGSLQTQINFPGK